MHKNTTHKTNHIRTTRYNNHKTTSTYNHTRTNTHNLTTHRHKPHDDNTQDNIEQTKKQDKMQNDKHARITDNK